jgi:disulfide bond formation protein DsbB
MFHHSVKIVVSTCTHLNDQVEYVLPCDQCAGERLNLCVAVGTIIVILFYYYHRAIGLLLLITWYLYSVVPGI